MKSLSSNLVPAIVALAGAGFLTFAGPVSAGEATYDLPQPVAASHSRAQVQAELLQARQAGTLVASEADFQKAVPFAAQKTRAEVAAEARNADVTAAYGEPHDFDVRIGAKRVSGARLVAAR